MNKQRLDEIRARADEANRCVWIVPSEVVPITGEMHLADFVDYARQDIPDLLAYVEELEKAYNMAMALVDNNLHKDFIKRHKKKADIGIRIPYAYPTEDDDG